MSDVLTYPLAKQGVFLTVQGEGHWQGFPQVFVRLAGCSVGCPSCDTDYRVAERVSAAEIKRRCVEVSADVAGMKTAWITGGEPTDHDLTELLTELHSAGFRLILATAGHREITYDRLMLHHLSVSPHDPAAWVQRSGDELKLCDRVNGFRLADFEKRLPDMGFFGFKYVSPLMDREGRVDRESLADCLAFVNRRPEFRLNAQAHKLWRVA